MKPSTLRGLSSTTIRSALIGAVLGWAAIAAAAPAKSGAESAPPSVTLDACSWDRPGHNPFMGDVVAAVDRYRDIPPEVRARLKARMVKRDYDDLVSIRRDSISGRAKYGTTIRDMHFGTHQVCRSVTRASWSAAMQERGLVYCESGQCILVPTVCRNVSRIARSAVDSDRAAAPEVAPADVAAAPVADPLDPADALLPDAPGALPLALDGAPSFQAPEDWLGPVAFGGGGSYVANSVAGGPGAGSHGGAGPNVSTASVPPFGSDSAAAPLAAAAVPEPQTWALLLVGLAALAWVQRRRRIRAC